MQIGAHAKRDCEHGPLGMANRHAVNDGHTERAEDALADFGNRGAAGHGRLAIGEIAEQYTLHVLQLTRLRQMSQSAIHLVRLHAAIFQNEDGASRVGFPAGAKGRLQHGQAATDNAPGGAAASKFFTEQGNLPFQFCFTDGLQEGDLVVSRGFIGAVIETRGNHGSVKAGPTAHLEKKELNDVQVAIADKDLWANERRGQSQINQIIRAVTPARGNHSINLLVAEFLAKLPNQLLVRAREVALRRQWRQFLDKKTKPAKFRDTRGNSGGFRGRRWRNNGNSGTLAKGFRLLQKRGAAAHSWRPSRGSTSVTTPCRFSCFTICSCWWLLTSASNSTMEFVPAMETRN